MKTLANRLLTCAATICLIVGTGRSARAQGAENTRLTSESGTRDVGGEPTNGGSQGTEAGSRKNPGVKLSDEAVLHAGVSTSVGYDSNVFYNDINKVES